LAQIEVETGIVGPTAGEDALGWVTQTGLRLVPAFFLLVLIVAALMAPVVAPHDPDDVTLAARFLPPVFQGGTWTYPLGTDFSGRDMVSRLMFGARTSLSIAAVSLLLGAAIGTCVGLCAGYARGRVDAVLMRVVDLGISYPVLLLALVLAAAFGPRLVNVVVVMAFTVWARFARVVRDQARVVRQQAYVAIAELAGAPPRRIVLRHVLPNLAGTILVLVSVQFGQLIIVESSLSFLGAGVPPPEPALGSMIADGREYLASAWWISFMPGLAVTAAVLAMNLLADWLRDRLDPHLRGV
jgi:peptide/nickel transport system permease protein